jgi:hypothetical protein
MVFRIRVTLSNRDILFTSTTYLAKDGKYEQIYKALTNFKLHLDSDRIRDYIIINEYDEKDTSHLTLKLKRAFPFVTIINKTADMKGQAKSLNHIIDILKENTYKYWIHWEESWIATRPFVQEAYVIMENSHVDQLQFNEAWRLPTNITKTVHKDHSNIDYTYQIVKYNETDNYFEKHIEWYDDNTKWPLYSLQPSINRVKTTINNGYFDESEFKWPVKFEYEYGIDWIKKKLVKGITIPHACERQENHKSTYK